MDQSRTLKNKRCGFTLTELAIVLCILGIVLGAIWTAYASVSDNRKVSQALGEIQYVLSNTKRLYGISLTPNSKKLTNTLISIGDVFPKEMMATGIPQNPWATTSASADVTGAGMGVGGQGSGFGGACPEAANIIEIALWGVPASACAKILAGFISTNAGPDVTCVYSSSLGAFTTPSSKSMTDLTGCANGDNVVIYFHM